MAHITLSGTLLDPAGELAVGDQVRFTHKSTTGSTVESSVNTLIIPPNGAYSVDIQYGFVMVEYKDARRTQFSNLGVATVNIDNPATSIPELLNALVPVSSEELIEFQSILADCTAEANRAYTEAERAETAAAIAESKPEADRAKAEADRAEVEADRSQTEANRSESEVDRAIIEADRAASEADRAAAEADRAEAAECGGGGGEVDLISDLSQDYIFATVAAFKTSTVALPVGKTVTINERTSNNGGKLRGIIFSGTGSANGEDIIASDTLDIVFVAKNLQDPYGVKNISQLKAIDATLNMTAITQGSQVSVDGKAASYFIVPGGTGVDDGVNYIDLDNGKQARLIKIDSEGVGFKGATAYSELEKVEPLESKFKKTLNSVNGWRAGGGVTNARVINVLGDSITYGAGAGLAVGIPDNAWVRVFQKMCNTEFGGNQYGFVSAYTADGTGRERHEVVNAGAWVNLHGADSGHLPNGWAMRSTTTSSTLTFKSGSYNKKAKIWYDGTRTGSFKVTLNETTDLETITTTGAGIGLEYTSLLDLLDDLTGEFRLKVTVLSGEVSICGIEYLDKDLDFRVNNYSRDGRAGRYVTETVIEEMCKGAYSLIWALGVNDRNTTGQDLADYMQRVDWLILYANLHGTRVIIPDFFFKDPDTHPIREKLLSASKEINSCVYLPIPNLISTDGVPKDTNYLINTINFSYDGVHLSTIGHRLVAELIAHSMGLSVTSKAVAESFDKSWWPMRLINGVTNSYSDISKICRYRFNGNTLELAIDLPTVASGTTIANLDLKGRAIPLTRNYKTDPDASGNTQILTVTTSGAVIIYNDSTSTIPTSTKAFLSVDTSGAENFSRYF